MRDYEKHLLKSSAKVREALARLNTLGHDLILFVVDDEERLLGTLTDGDVRRGLIGHLNVDDLVTEFMNEDYSSLERGRFTIEQVQQLRERKLRIIPILDEQGRIHKIINFGQKKSILPVDALIMAGGRGTRLRPLTDTTPKPLLKIGDKPIIEYNVDRLIDFGVDQLYISIKYLGQQLVDHFQDGDEKGAYIGYVEEDEPLGTIGALRLVSSFKHDYVLVMNSDLLTNIDFEDFFMDFCREDADLAVATIPYNVKVPYAVLETEDNKVIRFKEKPTYTYYSNAGIYLIKKEVIGLIPKNEFYNATDLMEDLIKQGRKVFSYPLLAYWLDIGKPEDFKKAQEDIKHIQF